MARRIIKEILNDGSTQYRVESNRVLWFIPVSWHSVRWFDEVRWNAISPFKAIFRNLDDAKKFCGVKLKKKIVKKQVVYPELEDKEKIDYSSLDYIPFNKIIEEDFWDLVAK